MPDEKPEQQVAEPLPTAPGGIIPTLADMDQGAKADILTAMSPADQGLITWAYDPASAVNTNITSGGIIHLVKVQVSRSVTVTSVGFTVTGVGSGLTTNNFVGLYDMTGILLGQTADLSTTWNTTGNKIVPFSTPISISAGFYYVAILANGTTPPTLSRSSGQATTNLNLTPGNLRFANIGSGLTSLPASLTLSSSVANLLPFWVGLL